MKEKQTTTLSERFLLLFAIGAIVLTAAAGCSKKDADATKRELVVLCGTSFVQPTEELCSQITAETGIQIVFSVGDSEDFLPLVKAGREGDVLISHDPFLDYIRDADVLGEHVHVGFVAPVLAVQKGNPKGIKSIDELTREGLKVALTDPKYSTCGELVFALLEKKGIKEAVMKNVGNRLSKKHSVLGTYLKMETVDAVIMWNGVAHAFKESLEVVQTPYEYDQEIRVHIMGLNYSDKGDLLKQFIATAREKGPAIFAEYGYVK